MIAALLSSQTVEWLSKNSQVVAQVLFSFNFQQSTIHIVIMLKVSGPIGQLSEGE
jgi:hypothetical protein